MKEARKRAVSGGGVKEVKTLAALQKELKVLRRNAMLVPRSSPPPTASVPRVAALPHV